MKNKEPQLTAKQLQAELKTIEKDLSELNTLKIYNKFPDILSKFIKKKEVHGIGKDILSEKTKQRMENREQLILTSPKTVETRRVIAQLSKDLRMSMRKDRKIHRLRTLENLIEKTGGTKKAIKQLQEKGQWISILKDLSGTKL
ncbi:unnamed protein product [Pieris brassicae]|uniref:Uncharacterized protein n=1 Tax=Pieris brassicae TaxID=7116 RepID=A0A9P0TEU5_PIEBR|nr:unnamed protein product [Pieris brassicae]